MNWIDKPISTFRYAGKEVTRQKKVFESIFGQFEVFESVGGNTFIRHPWITNSYIGPIGFNNGCEEWFGASKKQVKDMATGMKECEDALNKAKSIVATY